MMKLNVGFSRFGTPYVVWNNLFAERRYITLNELSQVTEIPIDHKDTKYKPIEYNPSMTPDGGNLFC